MSVGVFMRLGLARDACVSTESECVVVFVHREAFAVVEILGG